MKQSNEKSYKAADSRGKKRETAAHFKGYINRYMSITVDPKYLPEDKVLFDLQLSESLKTWEAEGIRSAWLEIPTSHCHLLEPSLKKFAFKLHHTSKDSIFVNKWLDKTSSDHLPHFCTH